MSFGIKAIESLAIANYGLESPDTAVDVDRVAVVQARRIARHRGHRDADTVNRDQPSTPRFCDSDGPCSAVILGR
jgi:hypothetical protein